jgi:hypothetical protein
VGDAIADGRAVGEDGFEVGVDAVLGVDGELRDTDRLRRRTDVRGEALDPRLCSGGKVGDGAGGLIWKSTVARIPEGMACYCGRWGETGVFIE